MKLPPNLKTNPNPNSSPNPNQGVVLLWAIVRTPYKYNSIELWNFMWLCKIIEKIRSRQDFILTNSCSEANFPNSVTIPFCTTTPRTIAPNEIPPRTVAYRTIAIEYFPSGQVLKIISS